MTLQTPFTNKNNSQVVFFMEKKKVKYYTREQVSHSSALYKKSTKCRMNKEKKKHIKTTTEYKKQLLS